MSEPTDARGAWVERVLGFKLPTAIVTGGVAQSQKVGVRLTEAMITWNRTRSHVGEQITRLQREILMQTKDDGDFDEISANIGVLGHLLDLLDDSLSNKLSELRAATDPATKIALSGQAKDIIIAYQKKVVADPLMNCIDDNGFIDLDIKPTVTAALVEVLASI